MASYLYFYSLPFELVRPEETVPPYRESKNAVISLQKSLQLRGEERPAAESVRLPACPSESSDAKHHRLPVSQ